MSVKAAEYLKRTCLICGCHTNQTINIYEPRSGPNIVHLIQAKFKFQPLNDDKYLCYSCNNWLINWHSLQALNSNEPESPAGTFRSHMDMVVQEKPDDKVAASKTPVNKVRPVARVSPRMTPKSTQMSDNTIPTPTRTRTAVPTPTLISSPNEILNNATTTTQQTTTTTTTTTTITTTKVMNTTRKNKKPLYMLSRKLSRNLKIYRTLCKICKRRIVCITQTAKCINIVKNCRKCRKAQKTHMSPKTQKKLVQINNNNSNASNNLTTTETSNKAQQTDTQQQEQQEYYRNQRWQPILDGKVVSKLRRLGTTLARDAIDGKRDILSEAKKKPQWERQLDDDEILLDFNTTISEVLPIEQRKQQLTVDLTEETEESTNGGGGKTSTSTYHISLTAFKKLGEKVDIPEFDHQLPKGLTISLVSY